MRQIRWKVDIFAFTVFWAVVVVEKEQSSWGLKPPFGPSSTSPRCMEEDASPGLPALRSGGLMLLCAVLLVSGCAESSAESNEPELKTLEEVAE